MLRLWIALLLTFVCGGCTITKSQIVVKHTMPSGVEIAATIEGEQ
jgi:hypothetical protein